MPIATIGGTIVLHRGFDPAEIWRTVERERCTVMLGVPTIWKLLAEAPEFAGADTSSVRCLYSGGAPLPTWIAELYQRRGLVFKQGFGMTEVGVNCFAMTVADSLAKLGSIGKPMMHTEVRFTIAGRAKEMIISGGVNVYPAEIEAVLLQHPGVRDAAVVGVEHPTWGEAGIAFVVPLAPDSAASEALLEWVGERLARYKLPQEIVHLAELPRTAYGKVVKGELKAQYLSRRAGELAGEREKIAE